VRHGQPAARRCRQRPTSGSDGSTASRGFLIGLVLDKRVARSEFHRRQIHSCSCRALCEICFGTALWPKTEGPGSRPEGEMNMKTDFLVEPEKITREEMVQFLNEDLAREYQAIIAYTVYSQVLKGAAYTDIAEELEKHAGEELEHALKISRQVDYFGGMPAVSPKQVKTSKDSKQMLQFDLENERQTILNYRQRIQQAEAMGEFALSEVLRGIIVQEQDHLIDLSDALGIEPPEIE
jgi:bacterioferritin